MEARISDVAEGAGQSHGSLHYYFDSQAAVSCSRRHAVEQLSPLFENALRLKWPARNGYCNTPRSNNEHLSYAGLGRPSRFVDTQLPDSRTRADFGIH